MVLGVSRDSVKAQKSFKEKHALPFPLLSDPDGKICKAYGVIKKKMMYGKKVKGRAPLPRSIARGVRSTFIIDGTGRVTKAYRGVKVEGHASEVFGCV